MTDTAELRRLLEAATPGEWLDTGNGFVRQGRTNAPIASTYGDREDSHQDERMSANAALIVSMRNALPELLKALEWQPIETAPKDGTWVMLHYRDECVPIISFFSDGAWAHQETMGLNKPTHWMPLPLPPHGGVDVG